MKSKGAPLAILFASSLAHVLLFLVFSRSGLSDGKVILLLIVLPAISLGAWFGLRYGYLALGYGFLFTAIYLTIGSLGLLERTTSGAVALGWGVEAVACSVMVLVASSMAAVPAAMLRAKRRASGM
ncbi:hypothetical protein [Aeoliella mucimassa]|uniref:Uncharacterized protein n=1 Tax=Aeoliella mucimassa TaxID=2527972 RepID=A0A518ASS7_9BACT|nr:hypothetical protein [Aeoliella mucimassa]QDU57746.1 hypothetical protein Pan181_39680 [Aeoliella mucimassa]